MDVRKMYKSDRVKITQTDDGEWWVLLLEGAMGEWEKTAIDRSLRGLLDGDHMRCFERFHASEDEREKIDEWRRQAGDPID